MTVLNLRESTNGFGFLKATSTGTLVLVLELDFIILTNLLMTEMMVVKHLFSPQVTLVSNIILISLYSYLLTSDQNSGLVILEMI
jgi:hypothetical protein